MKDLKTLGFTLIPVIIQQILASDKMFEVDTYWATTILTVSVLSVVYYLYWRLKKRIKAMKTFYDQRLQDYADAVNLIGTAAANEFSNINEILKKLHPELEVNKDKPSLSEELLKQRTREQNIERRNNFEDLFKNF